MSASESPESNLPAGDAVQDNALCGTQGHAGAQVLVSGDRMSSSVEQMFCSGSVSAGEVMRALAAQDSPIPIQGLALEAAGAFFGHHPGFGCDVCQDIAQELLKKLCERLDELRSKYQPQNLQAFLAACLRNWARDLLRARVRETARQVNRDDAYLEQLPGREDSPDEQVIQEEIIAIIQRTLRNSPARERLIYELRFQDELTFQAIADRMGLSVSVVHRICSQLWDRLRVSLRNSLGGEYP